MSDRIKSQDIKGVLFKNTKKEIISSLRNYLDKCACLYYFVEVLKDPIVFSYEKQYGAHHPDSGWHWPIVLGTTQEQLSLKENLSGAYAKVYQIIKDKGINTLDMRRYFKDIYREFYDRREGRSSYVTLQFNEMVRDSIALIYMYRGTIPPKKLSILEKSLSNDNFLDFSKVMARMKEVIDTIEWLLIKANKRIPIKQGDVFYKGKKVKLEDTGRISLNLKKALKENIQFTQNLSQYIYNYDSITDVPVIISPLVSLQSGFEGGYVNSHFIYYKTTVKRKNNRITINNFNFEVKTNYLSLTPIIATKDSSSAILATLSHECVHVWQNATKRKYPKRYNRFLNSWSRYFNELTRLRVRQNVKSSIAQQQRLDFLDGLSDYIKIRKTKKFHILELLDSNKKIQIPSRLNNSVEIFSNYLLLMVVPSLYGFANPQEFMAETIAFLAEDKKSELGFDLESDIPSFYVPVKRFLKLIDKYQLNKY